MIGKEEDVSSPMGGEVGGCGLCGKMEVTWGAVSGYRMSGVG